MKKWECPVMEELNIEMTAGGYASGLKEGAAEVLVCLSDSKCNFKGNKTGHDHIYTTGSVQA